MLFLPFFILKPAVTPKRPLAGDRSIPDEHGTDYESKRKQRKIEKMREAEEARMKEQRLREERQYEMKIKQESEEEKTNEVIQQILDQEPSEVCIGNISEHSYFCSVSLCVRFVITFCVFQSDIIDEFTLKKMILLFEKRTLKNQEMRIKFADTPEKYVMNYILM